MARHIRRPDELLPLTPGMFHVLIALADGEKHGYAIIKEVARRTDGAIRLSAGTLYTLIRLLPFDFRTDYGSELQRTFTEQHRDAAGRRDRARVWTENVGAILAVGPREHLVQLRQDVTYALRGMRRGPGFVLVALLTLALGTGVNTAIFSIVHAVLLKPLPYADPDRLMTVMNRWDGSEHAALSDPEYLDYSEQSRSLEIAAMARGRATLTGGNGEPQQASVISLTANAFSVLGRQPALGRGFGPQDERRGSAAAIIS